MDDSSDNDPRERSPSPMEVDTPPLVPPSTPQTLATPIPVPYPYPYPYPQNYYHVPSPTPQNRNYQQSVPSMSQPNPRFQSASSQSSSSSSTPRATPAHAKRVYATETQKLEMFWKFLDNDLRWTLGELLWRIFKLDHSHRTPSHAQRVSKFLGGEATVCVSQLLDAWVRTPDGLPSVDSAERAHLYSLDVDYRTIKAARPAITSFAAQIVGKELIREFNRVTQKKYGLHTFASEKRGSPFVKDVHGIAVFEDVKGIFRTHSPLSFRLVTELTTPKSKATNRLLMNPSAKLVDPSVDTPAVDTAAVDGDDSDESDSQSHSGSEVEDSPMVSERAPDKVALNILSQIAYSRNSRAKRLPLEKGLLNFACRTNRYVHSYDSRVAAAPSYHAVYEALKKLALVDADEVRNEARGESSSVVIRLDNVQNYVRPRVLGIGREARMQCGTAATAFSFHNFSTAAVDIDEKRALLESNPRKDLTFDSWYEAIDHAHIRTVCVLQWLRVLVNYVPSLRVYKKNVKERYKTKGAKRLQTVHRTKLWPLPTNGRNETITKELLQALLEFLQEVGITEDNPLYRQIYFGGDGLTYERMVLLKLYMQFHDTPFQRLEWLKPFLESWHTSWTDVSRIYEAHWDSLDSKDPSSLGHSANQVKRKAPASLQKVDFYPYSQLAFQILDARILDCWRIYFGGSNGDLLQHFERLEKQEDTPSFETLLSAFDIQLDGRYRNITRDSSEQGSEWTIPAGDVWVPPPPLQTDAEPLKEKKGKKSKKKKKDATTSNSHSGEQFLGDQVLAQSCRYMFDATLSREGLYAVRDGDPGRVWEVFKVSASVLLKSTKSGLHVAVYDFDVRRLVTPQVYHQETASGIESPKAKATFLGHLRLLEDLKSPQKS